MIRERIRKTVSGWVMLPTLLGAMAVLVWLLIQEDGHGQPVVVVGYVLALVLAAVMLGGLFVVNPNEARVLTLFGRYAGSVKQDGFHWANPLLTKRRISLRIRNFESTKLKVNDHRGQSHRDRSRRRVARVRDRRSLVRSGQLRALRQGPDRDGGAQSRDAVSVRHT